MIIPKIIIVDIPPQLNKYTDSALVASDHVMAILQAQEWSLWGAETYVKYFLQIKEDYKLKIDLLGVLPVLQPNGDGLGPDVIDDARKSFGGENLFNQKVRQMSRLKRFDWTGITDNPSHDVNDRKVHTPLYEDVVRELEQRLMFLKRRLNERRK